MVPIVVGGIAGAGVFLLAHLFGKKATASVPTSTPLDINQFLPPPAPPPAAPEPAPFQPTVIPPTANPDEFLPPGRRVQVQDTPTSAPRPTADPAPKGAEVIRDRGFTETVVEEDDDTSNFLSSLGF